MHLPSIIAEIVDHQKSAVLKPLGAKAGELIGAMNRIPSGNEFRGNMTVGAKAGK